MKKNYSLRIISVISAFMLIVSIFVNANLSSLFVSAEKEKSESKDTFNDYNDTTLDAGTYDENFKNIAGDLSPRKVIDKEGNTSNRALAYKQYHYGMGIVIPGHDYKSGKLSDVNNSIQVKAGEKYKVEFDYKILTNNDELHSNLTIGLTVHSPSIISDIVDEADKGNATLWSSDNGLWSHKVQKTTDLIFEQNTKPDSNWNHYTKEITIDDTTDLDVYNTLLIYIQLGNQSVGKDDDKSTWDYTFIDNVSVKLESSDTDESIFNDYNDSSAIPSNSTSARSDKFYQISGDLSPIADPTNSNHGNVLWYQQAWYGLGVVQLGHDYKSGTASNTIKAKPGKTYIIKYDYYLKGKVVGGSLDIGIALGTTALNGVDQGKYFDEKTSYHEESDSYVSEREFTGQWEKKTVTFKVPDDFTDTEKNVLQLYAKGGRSGISVYFDNISVKIDSGDTDDENFNDYDNSNTIPSNSTSSRSEDYYKISCDLSPIADPTNSNHGNVLWYQQAWYGLGVVQLGHDYKNGTATNTIKAIPGKTYIIDYDYYLKGKVGFTTLEIGIALGTTALNGVDQGKYFDEKTSYYEESDSYVSEREFKGQWEKKTVTFKVPDDFTDTEKNVLQLYAKGGSGINVYFDNISVKIKSDNTDDENFYDYNDSKTIPSNSTISRSEEYYKISDDLSPIADPTNSNHGNVLWYQQSHYGLGVVQLGHDYKSGIAANTIKAIPGKTYKIDYDYCIKGKVGFTPLEIGIALGTTALNGVDQSKYFDEKTSYHEESDYYISEKEFEGKWESKTVIFKVPDDFTDTEKNVLQLYAKGGSCINVYFDNVKVHVMSEEESNVPIIKFDTDGGAEIENITGAEGDPYTLPKNVTKEGCIFDGWYKDSKFENVATDGTFEKGTITLYAKFVRQQYTQGFEDEYSDFPVVKCDWFEYAFWYNTTKDAGSRKDWANWTAEGLDYQYDSTGVRNGTSSVYNPGNDAYERLFTLLLKDQLIVGEKYTISMWVKVDSFTLPGDIKLWFNNGKWNSQKLRTPVDWDSKKARAIAMVNTSSMKQNLEEWVEIKFDFVAQGKFLGIGIPGLTTCWIDDARVTLQSANDSFVRTIPGKGKLFDEWYGLSGEVEDVYKPIVVEPEKNIIEYADLFLNNSNNDFDDNYNNNDNNDNIGNSDNSNNVTDDTNNSTSKRKKKKVVRRLVKSDTPDDTSSILDYLWIIISGGVLLVGGITVAVILIVKKRRLTRNK